MERAFGRYPESNILLTNLDKLHSLGWHYKIESKTSPLSYDLSKAILRPVEQDLKREMSNSIFQKYFLI
jgi:hypothetical protein